MNKTNIFRLIRAIEQINNKNIVTFTKAFPYPIGISPILVLSELKNKGPTKQVELAETLGYTKGAMTNIATKLVSLGLAERLKNESDRRTIFLKITPAGITALSEAQKIGKEVFLQHFEALSDEELNQYLLIQEKLVKGIQDRKNKGNKS